MNLEIIPFKKGDFVTFSKTLGETDIYNFSGITGDFDPIHLDKEYASKTQVGGRIAHGVLLLGFSSTTSSMMSRKTNVTTVSYGYDKIRFIKPVFIGDTITVSYTIDAIMKEELKTISNIEITNQDGTLCVVAKHIMKYLPE